MIEYHETGEPIDADGRLADVVIDRMAATVSEYFPDFRFAADNVRASFDKLIDAESDPKIKGLLRLIEGLYLSRKQHADEHNVLFYRLGIVGGSLERGHRNIDGAFANTQVLYENDTTLVGAIRSMYDVIEKDSKRTKIAIRNLRKFRKRHEPRLKRLAEYIDENAEKFNEEKKQLR